MCGHRGVAASQYRGYGGGSPAAAAGMVTIAPTWTPVLGTTRRPRARDTLMLFYKHCCPMGPLLQTLTTPRNLSDQSVELSVPRRPRGSVGREMEKCGSALSLSASNTGAGGHQSRSPVTRHTFCARPQLAGHRSSS